MFYQILALTVLLVPSDAQHYAQIMSFSSCSMLSFIGTLFLDKFCYICLGYGRTVPHRQESKSNVKIFAVFPSEADACKTEFALPSPL